MRSVDVSVGHDDDAVIAKLREVEVFLPDPAAERRDHRPDFIAAEHLVEARLLNVQDFPFDRQDRLETAIAPLLGGAAGGLTLDDVELAVRRIAFLAIGELAGQAAAIERPFAPHELAGLARRLARACRIHGLADDAACDARVFFEKRPQLVVDDRLDDALDFRVAQLRLGLPFELRPRNLHADDRRKPFSDVVAADTLLQVLRKIVLARVEVHRASKGRAESREVRAPLVRIDVVGEQIDRFRVPVVPLQGDFGVDAVLLTSHVDRLVVDGDLVLVQVLDERDDATFVLELVALAVAFVVQRDEHARVQERELAKPLSQCVEAEFDAFENLRVRLEGDLRSAALGRAGDLELTRRLPALVALLVGLLVPPDFEVELLREGVDHRYADTVQTARHLVAVIVEFAARVQHRHDDFGRRFPARVLIDGNTAAVVDDGDRVVDVDRDVDLVAEPGQRFVDGVVHHLVDEVVEAGRTRRPDVHGRPLADSFQPLENLDLVRTVVVSVRCDVRCRSLCDVVCHYG